MFKKSKSTHQLDLFSSPNTLLAGKSLNTYEDRNSWHNQFRVRITNKISEEIFEPLYDTSKGCPNAPIRILVAMMVLKEARGMSDAELFENARYNLLTRSALGLMNVEDSVPTESTYYLFRKKILEHDKEHNINLLDMAFEAITQLQCIEFEVSGKTIRMDSKLLGSNIAWMSRYELIHETLKMFYREIKGSHEIDIVTSQELDDILSIDGNKVVYTQSTDEVKGRLERLGVLIFKLISMFNLSIDSFKTLKLVFSQHYDVDTNTKQVSAKEKTMIKAQSIQSPHDTDCDYRNKDGNKKKGYSVNISETCDSNNDLNLVTSVNVSKASTSDNTFLQQDIKDTEAVVQGKVEVVHADGAYHSQENQSFCQQNNITLHLHAIQGRKARYQLKINDKGEMLIFDTKTNQHIDYKIIITKNGETKWRIKTNKGYRYFTKTCLENSQLRSKIEDTPIEVLQKRNNVEATIFQLGYHYPNDKSRYRGIEKQQMWASVRCIWMNFVRILNFVTQTIFIASKYLKKYWTKDIMLTVYKLLQSFDDIFTKKWNLAI